MNKTKFITLSTMLILGSTISSCKKEGRTDPTVICKFEEQTVIE